MGPPPGHAWLRGRLGDELFDSVTAVSLFRRPGVTDAEIALLDAFPDLADLHLSRAPSATSPTSPISRSSGA